MEEFPALMSWPRPSRLQDPKSKLLAKVLAGYDLASTAALVGGLMTLAQFQANAVRLETLAQLVAGACAGSKKATHQNLDTWLNRQMGRSNFLVLEDPAEDVFVVNVVTPAGDFRVFPGLWEQGAFAAGLLISTVAGAPGDIPQEWLRPVLALLQLSDLVVGRSGLQRWHMEPSTPRASMKIASRLDLPALAQRVMFTRDDLVDRGINPGDLELFVFDDAKRPSLLLEETDETALHRQPLLRFGDRYVLAMPSAVDYAIRWNLLGRAADAGALRNLAASLFVSVRSQVQEAAGLGSRHTVKRVHLPREVQLVSKVCASLVVEVGGGRFVHYLLIDDDLQYTASAGLLSPHQTPEDDQKKINAHVTGLRRYLEERADVRSGHTVMLSGFLGQARALGVVPEDERWTSMTMGLADLLMFLRDPDDPVDRMIFLFNQEREMAGQGLKLPNHNGFLNLYQYWSQLGFNLRHPQIRHGVATLIQLEIDYVATYRHKRRRVIDEHCVPLPGGHSTVVQRSNSDSVYASLREVPSYVSLDLLRQGILGFLIESEGKALWVIMAPPEEQEARDTVFELWNSLGLLIHRATPRFVSYSALVADVSEIVLDFSELIGPRGAAEQGIERTSLTTVLDDSRPAAIVRADPGFLRAFDAVENRGEQYLLAETLRGISMLGSTNALSETAAKEAALAVLGGTDARVLHTFRVWNEVEILLANNPQPIYQRPKERIESALRTAFTVRAALAQIQKLDAEQSVKAFADGVVGKMQLLQARLRGFNRAGLIKRLLEANETLIADRQRWRYTARAIRGLYGEHDGTQAAQDAERNRAQLQVSLRALVEAAACECRDDVVREPDGYEFDELVGEMASMIELGRDSDVVFFGLASRGVTLFPSGAYALDADVLSELAVPFMAQSFDTEFKASADSYETWTRREAPAPGADPDDVFDSDKMRMAWVAEYGLSFDAFREIIGEIQDLAVARGAVVVTATPAEIAANRKSSGLTEEAVRAFLRSFGLPRRATWPAQSPYAPKDVKPWRFERQLSVSLRPFILEDEQGSGFTYGVGTARESLMYVLDSIRNASFDKDVFRSREMRSWLGGAIDALGHAFAEEVAGQLRALGWNARTEVKLRQLGAPKMPDLGDVDVLAWRADGVVLAIECKRLKASRTIAEIAAACDRFQGNVDDLLHKHMRRRDWILGNLEKVAKFCDLKTVNLSTHFPLVVNRVVPFKYVSALPIPASDVVLAERIKEYLAQFAVR